MGEGAPVSGISIRRCGPGDEDRLALVGQATFLETFAGVLGGADIVAHCARAHAPALYRQWLDASGHALWLVEAAPEGAPVGYMMLAPPQLPVPDAGGDREVKRIYLLGRFRGGGLGTRLLEHAVADARAAGARRLLLGVYTGNAAAIAFYRRMGFARIGERTFDIGGRAYDDHILALALQPAAAAA